MLPAHGLEDVSFGQIIERENVGLWRLDEPPYANPISERGVWDAHIVGRLLAAVGRHVNRGL